MNLQNSTNYRLVSSTDVDRVQLGYGSDEKEPLDQLAVERARKHAAAGEFAKEPFSRRSWPRWSSLKQRASGRSSATRPVYPKRSPAPASSPRDRKTERKY
jgi:hypothetical protein